ncbi:MAG: AraC family transcriptional regulator [Kiritimatiellae bacterium]|jgi:AraC-like DNA-binding protein|nr:AraC family transcriptional regulator [Kiritimatiellia bacterium]
MNKVTKCVDRKRDLSIIYRNTPEQGVFDLAEAGLPAVPALGFSRYGRSIECVEAHRHADCLEIGLCLRGALTLLNNRQEHRIMPGDLYINKPENIHCLTTHPKSTMIHWLLIRNPKKSKSFLRLTAPEAKEIWTRLNHLPCHIIAKTDAVKHAFKKMFKYHEQEQGLWRTVGLTNACTSILMEIIDASTHKSSIDHPQLIEQLVESIREQPEKNVSIDQLAREARLSPSLLISQFKQITGLPPYQFQLACRLEKAKHLLTTTELPITRIAFDLGFCASQHFSGHFKRAFGITPTAWRKQTKAAVNRNQHVTPEF